jgi:hypothetical protein
LGSGPAAPSFVTTARVVTRAADARRPVAYIVAAQGIFLTLLTVCVRINPTGLTSYNGISYYGAHARTFVPYALACLLTGSLLVLSARSLPTGSALRTLRRALILLAALLLAIVLTPYSLGTAVNVVHTITAACLFALQLWLGLWLVRRAGLGRLGLSLWIVQVLLVALAALALARVARLMLAGEVSFELVACLLYIRAISSLAGDRSLRSVRR